MIDPADLPFDQRSPDDVCMCGDARRQHQNGTGHCLLTSLCTPGRCVAFRLCWTAAEYAANEADLSRRIRESREQRGGT